MIQKVPFIFVHMSKWMLNQNIHLLNTYLKKRTKWKRMCFKGTQVVMMTGVKYWVHINNALNLSFMYITVAKEVTWALQKHQPQRTKLHAMIWLSFLFDVGYSVVGEFITQAETAEHISKTLQQIRSWNPMWNPRFFMTDYSEAELSVFSRCANIPAWQTTTNMVSVMIKNNLYFLCYGIVQMLHQQTMCRAYPKISTIKRQRITSKRQLYGKIIVV